MHFQFSKATTEDFSNLLRFAKETFVIAYEHLNDPAEFLTYLAAAFHPESFKKEMINPNSQFWMVESDEDLIGYFKVNFVGAQTDINDDKSIEIERIYVAQKLQGKGIGKLMLDRIQELAREKGLEYIWLGVWDQNPMAINFYKREGFKMFGTHIFTIGSLDQIDYLMKKYL